MAEPEQSGIEPEQSGIEPKRSGIQPEQSGIEPERSGIEPEQSGIEPEQSEIDKYRERYDVYQNYWIPTFSVKQIHWVKNFDLHPDDLFVASLPKTGTTWTQQIVTLINNGADIEDANKSNLQDRFPYIEYKYPSAEVVSSMPPPRLVKTHLPYELLPDKIKNKEGKVIYIARNPKDSVVSYYHFIRMIKEVNYRGSLEDLVEAVVTDTIGYGPWWKHYAGFWERRNEAHVLFITYEDLHKDHLGGIKRIADFMGKSLTDEQLNIILKETSFSAMSKNKTTNYSWMKEEGNINEGVSKFMRKGKIGDWKNHFTDKMSESMDRWLERHVTPTGLEFTFEMDD